MLASLSAATHTRKLSIFKYNVEAPNTQNLKVEMLLKGVMIRGLPTLCLFHDGEILATHSGAITETGLDDWLEENLFSNRALDSVGNNQTGQTQDSRSQRIEAKRGFVSMTSQFGSDDYMLSNE